MKKKKIIKLIIVLLILVFILIGITFLIKFITKDELVDGKYTAKDLEIIEEQVDSYLSNKITPSGMATLYSKYDGDNDLNDIYRGLFGLVDYLPTISKKVDYNDNEKIEKFFEKNKEDIKNNLKINGVEKFKKFIAYLNKVGYTGQEFISCEIDDTTYSNTVKYLSFDVKFKFEGLEDAFKLKVNFSRRNSSDMLLYFSIIEDEVLIKDNLSNE